MKIPLDQPPPHGSNERSHRPALQICQALAPTHIWLFKKPSDGRLLLLYFSFAQLHQHDQRCLLTCISLCVSLIILRGRAAIVRGGEERQAEGDRGFASKVWNPQTQSRIGPKAGSSLVFRSWQLSEVGKKLGWTVLQSPRRGSELLPAPAPRHQSSLRLFQQDYKFKFKVFGVEEWQYKRAKGQSCQRWMQAWTLKKQNLIKRD